MAKNFSINFVNGEASNENIEYGSYTLDINNVAGYSVAAITPSTITVDSETATLDIELTADGAATLTITDSDSEPITNLTSANFKRYVALADETGYDPSADAVDITNAATGVYVLKFLPYIIGSDHEVYFKISGDDFTTKEVTLFMNAATIAENITLVNQVTVTPTLVDAKYSSFPLDGSIDGTIS